MKPGVRAGIPDKTGGTRCGGLPVLILAGRKETVDLNRKTEEKRTDTHSWDPVQKPDHSAETQHNLFS